MMAVFSQSSSQKSRGMIDVVLVGCSQSLAPAVELAYGDSQPSDQPARPASPVRLAQWLMNWTTASRVRLGNPGSVQSSPSSFFSLICSSMSSERTSCLRWSFCSRRAILRSLASAARRERGSNAAAAFSKNSFCQR